MENLTFIEKVLLFKDLNSKYTTEGLDIIERETYNELFNLLQYQKFKDIENYRLDFTTEVGIDNTLSTDVIEEEEVKELITDIYEEMVQTIKQIHQKFINEGELEVDDVLLYDSIYPQLKKEGYFVDKYKIR